MSRATVSLRRFTCVECGAVELVRGGSAEFRCGACREAADLRKKYPSMATGKQDAQRLVAAAITEGRMLRPSAYPCADCGGLAVEYEHRDYNKPLDVEPICHRCNLLRGPAIPVDGSLQYLVSRGRVPYYSRRAVEILLSRMGGDPNKVRHLPKRNLNIAHWQEILPLFPASPQTKE